MPDFLRDALHLRARSPLEVLGGYLLLSWLVLQVAETLASLVGLPLWFGKGVLLLLGAGLPMVVLTAVFQRGRSGGAAEEAGDPLRRWTWTRTLQAGVVGFALLGIATAGHLLARSLGVGPVGTLPARGVLRTDPELVVASLHDHAHDPEVADALTQALRIHLAQSPSVSLASRSRVEAALERMGEASRAPLDLDRAREVAIREGAEGVVGGEVHRVGSGWTVSVVLLDAATGAELHAGLETVTSEDELIGAVQRLSLRLRERMGESLASVRRSPPLSRVRTPSLAALESYTRAVEANGRGDFEACILHNDQALALDTLFATAYAARAACRLNLGREPAAERADWERAYRLRERMTERERLRLVAFYHQHVAFDRPRAVDAWTAYLDRFPSSPAAHFSLGNLHAGGRSWDRAEALLDRGLDLDSSSVVVLVNRAGYQTYQGRFDEAERSLDRLAEASPGLDLSVWRTALAWARADWEEAEDEIRRGLAEAREDPGRVAILTTLEGLLHWTRGRRREGERALLRAMRVDSASGALGSFHRTGLGLAELRLDAAGDTAGTVSLVDALLQAVPLNALLTADREDPGFIALLARAGRAGRARALLREWEVEVAPTLPRATVPPWVRAALAEAEGDLEAALEAWRAEDRSREDPVAGHLALGRLHDRLGAVDSARIHYEAYLETPSRVRYETDPAWRGRVLERLVEMNLRRGDRAGAARRARELAELWSSADPELRARAEAARSATRGSAPGR